MLSPSLCGGNRVPLSGAVVAFPLLPIGGVHCSLCPPTPQVLKYEVQSAHARASPHPHTDEGAKPRVYNPAVVPAATFLQCRTDMAAARLAYARERVDTAKLDRVRCPTPLCVCVCVFALM